MKRKILFRGLREDGRGWAVGDLIQYGRYTSIRVDRASEVKKPIEYIVIPKTVGQFTGKTESKNHPMFDDKINLWEDDVFTVGSSKTKYQVMFDDYEWIGVSNEGDDWGLYKYRLSAIKEPIHILGNVHDNPQIFNEAIKLAQ